MKKLALFTLLIALAGVIGGCTPAYTAGERANLIGRSMDYEFRQMQDDIDTVFMLRPPSRLTAWNVR